MPPKQQNQIALIARILISILFLISGISKMDEFAGTVGYIASKGLPIPELGAAVGIIVEVGGSLALITGFKTRFAALVLSLFTFATALFFHNFWAVPPNLVLINQVMFLKNMSITGGLLMLVAFGPGARSMDAKLEN